MPPDATDQSEGAARRRPYVPVIGRKLNWLLTIVFGLFALLALNSVYLVSVTIAGTQYQNWFYMNMFLVHLGLGLLIILPVVVFGAVHMRNAWGRPNRRAIRMWATRFAAPFSRASRFSSVSSLGRGLPATTRPAPPCILSARIVATSTTQSGVSPLATVSLALTIAFGTRLLFGAPQDAVAGVDPTIVVNGVVATDLLTSEWAALGCSTLAWTAVLNAAMLVADSVAFVAAGDDDA